MRKAIVIKLLLTNPSKFTNFQIEEFKKLGYEISTWIDEFEPLSKDLFDSDVVICNSLFMHNKLSNFNQLKMIQLTSVGTDRVPVEEIKKKGIRLENAGDVYSIPMAEWVMLKILEIYKETRFFEEAQYKSLWRKNRNLMELNGKVIGVLGTGNVGIEVSKRAKAFGTKTVGFNTTGNSVNTFDVCYSIQDLLSVIGEIDILVLAVPLTEKTMNLINAKVFNTMKNNAIIINVSRGRILNEADLIEALDKGKVRGAALDVFSEEPLSANHQLWKNPKVIISPHNSFVSDNVEDRLFQVIFKNLSSLIT
ncbi:dihydrofolate reductase [Planomicrobium chinense]|uniref:NAD(P)-dependent oxidoreductase n=1 Tax=Planococcus chinensis TaxID=272917 RepID=UPI001CC689C1|nr:NAD(P)-dependent oxidoreductase [Planococcus chinensis]MBZ5202046.1 dihydrofolate reductase [Planococcus chinensis]